MDVILYSTNCPKCKVLKSKLNQKNISFTENNDVELMNAKGFTVVPKLEVNNKIMDFKEAVDWIGGQ